MGLDDECSDCDTISELEEMKGNLETLRDKFGKDFQLPIRSLEERIAQESDEPEQEEPGNCARLDAP